MTGVSAAGLNAELTPELRDAVKDYMDQTFENSLRKVGQTVRFNCGHPITDKVLSELVGSVLAWTFNNEPLVMDPSRMFFYKGNLDVADLIPLDTGVYECVVKWGSGNMFENISVGVYSLQVTSDTPTRYVFENDPMTLVCHSQTLGRLFPASMRRWLLNETAVTSLAATLAENKTSELVPRVDRTQAGVWGCQVTHSRTNRTWDTAWLHIGVDEPPSFAARWFRAMADHKALVFMIIGLIIIVSFAIFLYSAFRLKKTEDESEKEFIKERKGWQETLNGFVEKGQITAADFPDPKPDDESSLQDEEEDSGDLDEGQDTSDSEGGLEENTEEDIEDKEMGEKGAKDYGESEDGSTEDEDADENLTGKVEWEDTGGLELNKMSEDDQIENDDVDLNETEKTDHVMGLDVVQSESDDAELLNEPEEADQIMTGGVPQNASEDAILIETGQTDQFMMEDVDRNETDDEAQNVYQRNMNAWMDGARSSALGNKRQNLVEYVNECRGNLLSKEKTSVSKRTDVDDKNKKKKKYKEKMHMALNQEMAFKWLFKHSPHLKKLDSIMKEVSAVSLVDLDYSPPRNRGLVVPSGSVVPSKSDQRTMTGNRAQHTKFHCYTKVPTTSQRFHLQKVDDPKQDMVPLKYFPPGCSKVMSDRRRKLEHSHKYELVHPGSQPWRHSPWLPRFVERWTGSTRRADVAGRRVKYVALTQDDYV